MLSPLPTTVPRPWPQGAALAPLGVPEPRRLFATSPKRPSDLEDATLTRTKKIGLLTHAYFPVPRFRGEFTSEETNA